MTEIKLDYPIRIEGVEVKALKMRRSKVRDMLAADKATGSEAEKEVTLFANLCEVSTETIGDMDTADYQKLQEAYSGFLS